jgi:hypothetical protein
MLSAIVFQKEAKQPDECATVPNYQRTILRRPLVSLPQSMLVWMMHPPQSSPVRKHCPIQHDSVKKPCVCFVLVISPEVHDFWLGQVNISTMSQLLGRIRAIEQLEM